MQQDDIMAFPTEGFLGSEGRILQYPESGMTLRDYFAGQVITQYFNTWDGLPDEDVAKAAYTIADAMLKVRKD